MKKTFITNISLQGKGDLLKVFYEPQGFEMRENRETSFPIVPVIAMQQEEGDEVTVLAVRPANEDTPDNYAVFLEELKGLGIEKKQVKEIPVAECQSDNISLGLLMRLLREVPEDSLVYGDITFGTKPMSAILLYAMRFVEKVKNCEVDGIYYGEIRRVKGQMSGTASLYDLTTFKLLGDVIDHMKELEIHDIESMLNRMLQL